MQNGDHQNQAASGRPRVPYVRILVNDNLSECPTDQYHLVHALVDLEYSRDRNGGSVVTLPVKLSYCPVCRNWFVDHIRLDNLVRQGVDLGGIDFVYSPAYPRPAAYEKWHPLVEPLAENTKKASTKIPAPVPSAPRAKPSEASLAFQCLYCNGGQNNHTLGFRGVCSQDCYFDNTIQYPDQWCASPQNRCRDFKPDQHPTGDGICMESHLLTDWQLRSGQAPAGNHIGGIALATTLLPRESEVNRRVFAIFLIAAQETRADGIHFIADPRLRFELTMDEPLYFWKYMSAKGQPDDLDWRDNCRTASQSTVIRLLHRASKMIKDADRRLAAELLYDLVSSKVTQEQLKKLIN